MKFAHYKFLKKNLLEKALSHSVSEKEAQPSPLVLAYLGDVLFSAYVRRKLYLLEANKVQVLNDISAQMVSAVLQAKALNYLQDFLTAEEVEIVRKGRNTKSSVPKSASMREYRQSTGFECFLGWLFWQDRQVRLEEVMQKAFLFLAAYLLKKENGELE